jgi:hypothetical protein
MRVTKFLMTLALAATYAAPANACIVNPSPAHLYWPAPPEMLHPGEVALEVVFVRHPPKEEDWPAGGQEVVVVTSCGEPVRYTFRVLQVLRGDYAGPPEINTAVLRGIVGELKDGKSRIVVGQVGAARNGAAYMEMRQNPEGWVFDSRFPTLQ